MKNFIKIYKSEIVGAIICLGLGMLSGLAVKAGDSIWYKTLIKPSFNPPSWIFGPAWSVLYIMMGIALGKIWHARHSKLLMLFATQFLFNLAWSPLFFYFNRLDLALLDIGLLWIGLLALLASALKYRAIFLLLLPYFLWVSFAALLTFSIFKLNG